MHGRVSAVIHPRYPGGLWTGRLRCRSAALRGHRLRPGNGRAAFEVSHSTMHSWSSRAARQSSASHCLQVTWGCQS